MCVFLTFLLTMECEGKFYFTSEQLADTPSTKDGILIDDEINCHKKSAIFIQSLGEKLKMYPFS